MTFDNKFIATSADGSEIKGDAKVSSVNADGKLERVPRSVTFKISVDVDENSEFIHPQDGKKYKVKFSDI